MVLWEGTPRVQGRFVSGTVLREALHRKGRFMSGTVSRILEKLRSAFNAN